MANTSGGLVTISDPPNYNNTSLQSRVTIPTQPTPPQSLTPQPATNVGIGPRMPTAPLTGAPNGNGGIVPQPAQAPPFSFGAGNVVQDYLTQLTNPNSPYMRNATQRGLEIAGQRGNLNSSIAAGAARRASLEAVQPFVSEAMGLHRSREGYAAQDWLNSNQFNREFSSALALMPIKSSFDMLQTLMSYGAENPQIYTPTVMSGLSNFFNQNMQDIMSRYFPQGGTP